MKKIFYLIIGVLMSIPLFVKADMGSPMIETYKASIKNPEGAHVYKYDSDRRKYLVTSEVLPYGKEITVWYEEEGYAHIEENNGTVKLTDITPVVKNYSVNLKDLLPSDSAIVLVDQEIKKGPAEAYDGTGTVIPAGTKISIRFFDSVAKESDHWVYVEYNGVKGFIDTLGAKIAYGKINDQQYMTNKLTVVKDPKTGEEIKKINVNTIIKGEVYVVDPWSRSYYLICDDFSGLVLEFDLAVKNDEPIKYTILQDMNIFETIDEDAEVVGTITEGTVINAIYQFEDKGFLGIYYEKGNIKGWVTPTYDMNSSSWHQYIELYADYEKENLDYYLSQNEEVSSEEDIYYEEDEPQSYKNPKETLYICIGIGFIICVTGGVIIALVNKKKKDKK